jgi:uncharacterized protein YjiS (DUF1127 family)
MLYRSPRFAIVDVLRAAVVRLAAGFAQFRRIGADTAYLDTLPEHQLRDLGLRRFTDRHETYYR